MVWKTLVAQQRTNAQLNSHMALARNGIGFTLVRGGRFTHTNHATQYASLLTIEFISKTNLPLHHCVFKGKVHVW